MGCCKDKCSSNNGGCGLQNSAFLIIVLFILLAIIWLAAFYWMYKGMVKKAKLYTDQEV